MKGIWQKVAVAAFSFTICLGVFYKLPHLESSIKSCTLCLSILYCIFISKFSNHSPLCFCEFVNKSAAR